LQEEFFFAQVIFQKNKKIEIIKKRNFFKWTKKVKKKLILGLRKILNNLV
jgi:hypothetical protein